MRAAIGLLLATSIGCAGAAGDAGGGATGTGGVSGAAGITGNGSPVGTAGTTGAAGSTGAAGNDAGVPPLPPETELESSYEVPVATGRLIWVANPLSGRVAYVDATTLDVKTVQAGNAPTYMAAIPGTTDDAVIVLNALSQDASLLRVSGQTLTSRTITGLAPGANAVSVSPDGIWAIAWTDVRRVQNLSPLQGFQDITVMDLRGAAPAKPKVILSVGFRPVAVAFNTDGTRAFAVTVDGVAIIDLAASGGPRLVRNVALTDDPTENADTRDVSITPNGALALVRREGNATIGFVDLAAGTRSSIDLGGPVTDLDITDDGKRAVAVVRSTSEVAILPLEAGVPTATSITRLAVPGQVVGSVALAPGGASGVLYSNATALERLTVLTLGSTPSLRVVRLHAPVLSAFVAAGARAAVVLHAMAPATTTTDGGVAADGGTSVVDAGAAPLPVPAPAFSLVPLDADLPAKIAQTTALPLSVALSPSADRALITVRDDVKKIYGVYMGLFPTLEIQHFPLASPPVSAGVVAGAGRGYVAQKHPEGRITFVTLDSGAARTLTGFELGARVVDWSQPR
jgi:hypothetical protein